MASKRQIDANRRNWAKRRGLTPEGRERLRAAALRFRPWEHSTGPQTEAGRRRSRENAVYFGDFSKTIEPFAAANAAIRAEGTFGSAASVMTLLARQGLPNDSTEQETWSPGFFKAIAAVAQAQRERQAAWRRFAAALGLPEPAESADEGFDWCGHVFENREDITPENRVMALGSLCAAHLRACVQGAWGLWPNMRPMRALPSTGV
jgi:hypothetical protein